MATSLSSVLPSSARWFIVIVGLVSLLGTTLIWYQGILMPIWPVVLKPFNARFFGATYFSIITYCYFLFRNNRHDPGRLVISLSLAFSGMVAFITLFHTHEFLWERRIGTTGWFIFYFLPTFWALYYIRRYRNEWNVGALMRYPAWLYRALQVQAALSTLYALLLVLAPGWATAWWPWSVDLFHARAYSGIFLALGIGAYLLQKGGGQLETQAMGWGQTMLGGMVIGGFLYTDQLLHKANWEGPGTWLWLAYFVALIAAGVGLLRAARAADKP